MNSSTGWKLLAAFVLGAAVSAMVMTIILKPRKTEVSTVSAVPERSSMDISMASQTAVSAVSPGVSPALPSSSLASAETAHFQSFLSGSAAGHTTVYVVQSGDNLTRISKKHQVTVDLIKKVNQLPSDVLKIGMKLKIPTQRLSLVVDKSQNTLILKGNEDVLKTYHVSTGSNNSTPVGVFKVTDKLINPTWYTAGAVVPPGSAENVLGTRWLGINAKGYGIHGTVEPDKIGQQVTAGCVRMRNEEVEELYSLVPAGTEVTILD